jgi:hypothetical protein
MSLRFITGLAVAVALVSTPALACKGRNTVFSDDFSREDSAWEAVAGDFSVSGGRAQVKSESGKLALIGYNGEYFDSGDACVDVISPNVRGGVLGGFMFAIQQGSIYAVVVSAAEGTAGVVRFNKDKWMWPVSARKVDSIKPQVTAPNTIRVTWKGSAATAYINDKQFANFTVQTVKSAPFGLFAMTEGETYQFRNLKITD